MELDEKEKLIAERDHWKKLAIRRLFLLQDTWPYIHQWCTINTLRARITDELFNRKNKV